MRWTITWMTDGAPGVGPGDVATSGAAPLRAASSSSRRHRPPPLDGAGGEGVGGDGVGGGRSTIVSVSVCASFVALKSLNAPTRIPSDATPVTRGTTCRFMLRVPGTSMPFTWQRIGCSKGMQEPFNRITDCSRVGSNVSSMNGDSRRLSVTMLMPGTLRPSSTVVVIAGCVTCTPTSPGTTIANGTNDTLLEAVSSAAEVRPA